jgi:hypothetical protein
MKIGKTVLEKVISANCANTFVGAGRPEAEMNAITSQSPQPAVIPTWGKLLADGRILELVLSSGSSRPSLLFWDGRKVTRGRSIRIDTRSYVVPQMDTGLRLGLRLPPGYKPYGSTHDLFSAISNAFEVHGGQRKDAAQLASYFVMASHVIESLNTAPCLLLTGSATTEAMWVLRVLAALCRHSLPVVSLSVEALRALPSALRPTILLHAPEQGALAESLIRASSLRGFGVLRRDGLRDLFCAKAICIGRELLQGTSADSCIRIRVAPARGPAPVWDDGIKAKLAAELQPKLLAYRLKNLEKVRFSSFDVPGFSGAARDVARSLGASIVGDQELQQMLIPLLLAQDEAIRVERTTELDSLVAEALLVLCHEPAADRVHVGEVSKLVNGIRRGRGDSILSQAREVGAKLRALGLFSQRDAKGYCFRLSTEAKRKVHQFALDLDVPAIRQGFAGCPLCPGQPAN